MKQWFPVEHTNHSRARAGSMEGIAGRRYPILIAMRLQREIEFRRKVCDILQHHVRDFKDALAGESLEKNVPSVISGARKTPSKTTLRILWNDNTHSNFIVKKSGPAHICLKKVAAFIPEFEEQFSTKIPAIVRESLLLFVGGHQRQKEILDSIPVNFVGDDIRDVERAYHNRLTLASMYGHNEKMANALMAWLRSNVRELMLFCFSRGAAKSPEYFAEYLWYHSTNGADSDIEIFDLNLLAKKLGSLTIETLAKMVRPGDREMVGSTIALPFGNVQYHEDGVEFRHDRDKIFEVIKLRLKNRRRNRFGSSAKISGHENEILIASALNDDKLFRAHFCCRVGRKENDFISAEAGGKNARREISVLDGKTTQGKTDVAVLWKDGTYTNISIKKATAGQVYLVTAKNFVAVYESQYNVIVPSKVRRALAYFVGEDPESRSILDATDISIDGSYHRGIAYKQQHRLMFSVINNYDPNMANELLAFLHDRLANVFELCFAAGAVKDKSLWSDVLWYKNLVDPCSEGLDYLVSIPEVKAAIKRKLGMLNVGPTKDPGSTIQLPFGHLQYFHRQLEFYQQLSKIQALLTA